MISRKSILLLIGILLVLLISTTVSATDEQLWGSWRLVKFVNVVVATGEERTGFFGPSSPGIINYGRDGRVLLLIVGDKRPKVPDLTEMSDKDRLDLFKTMIACGGTYTFDGKIVRHTYDISWNENWTGTSVIREVKFEGNRLTLIAPPAPSTAGTGELISSVLVWEKIQ
jgi:hypothetical protein